MVRRGLYIALVVSVFVGCTGNQEIAPTTEAGPKIEASELKDAMQKSIENNPNLTPQQRAMMEQQMKAAQNRK